MRRTARRTVWATGHRVDSFWTNLHLQSGRTFRVDMDIDVTGLLDRLGVKAAENKGKKSSALDGLIKVTAKQI